MFLALVMCLTLAAPAWAVGPETEVATEEYTYAYLLPNTAENVQYLSDGTILFKDGMEYKSIDGATGEVSVFMTRYPSLGRSATVNHVPADIGSDWVFWRTDGPTKNCIDWARFNHLLNGDYLFEDLVVALAGTLSLPISLIIILVEFAAGGVIVEEFWEIDDAYTRQSDIGAHRVEIYMYFDEACQDLKGHDYMEYHDPMPDL